MNILLIHNRYASLGGEDQVFEAEKAMLIAQGHKVICYERSNTEIEQFDLLQKLKFLGKDMYWSKQSQNELKALIRQHRLDIAHIHNTFYMISPSVYEVCQEEGLPIVQTLHNYRFLCPAGTFFRNGHICHECQKHGVYRSVIHACWKNSALYSLMLVKVIKNFYRQHILSKAVSVFIAPSSFTQKMFIEAGFDAAKIVVKPNFVDIAQESYTKQDYGVYVGALRDYKGIQVLIEALKLNPAMKFRIIGDGPLRKELEKQVQGLSVTFLGWQSSKEVFAEMSKARFLVAPSQCYETFGRSVIEAFACATPVIVSRLGALQELVDEGQTGLCFNHSDAADLANKMQSLYNNAAFANQMGKQAREIYENKYTLAKNYHQLIKIYNDAIESFKLKNLVPA